MQLTAEFETVHLDATSSYIITIDQTKLPNQLQMLKLKTPDDVWLAIRHLQVRGAPAIGVTAAFGLYLSAAASTAENFSDFYAEFQKIKAFLATARPTAVNLSWALDRMEAVLLQHKNESLDQIKRQLLLEAERIKQEDIQICRRIGENGLTCLQNGFGLLTHCNAGRLATMKYGTALSPIYLGLERGIHFRVFVDETRPLLQGARLTAFELQAAGIRPTLLCDNMVSSVMQKGWIQAVLVGADRIVANGDTANKIGTSGISILAKYYHIPFYVCAPLSTFDLAAVSGREIIIEERAAEEVTEMWYKKRMAPQGISVYNPAFDVTDQQNITAIITEQGIARPPFAQSIAALFQQKQAEETRC